MRAYVRAPTEVKVEVTSAVRAGGRHQRGDHPAGSSSSGCRQHAEGERRSGRRPPRRSVVQLRPGRRPQPVADVARRPGGGSARTSALLRRRPRARPAIRVRAARRGRRTSPGVPAWSSWPSTSGRCCSSVPPRATLSTCIPRQTPRSGSPASSAARTSARSNWSRTAGTGTVRGSAGLAVAGRVRSSAAPLTISAVEQRQQVAGARGVLRVGQRARRRGRPRAGRRGRRGYGVSGGELRPGARRSSARSRR